LVLQDDVICFDMPSTVISSYHYDQNREMLKIIFVSGMVYHYKKVPADVFNDFKSSFSKGAHFNQHIKNNYESEKMTE
jgi:hypothetical protein